MNIEDYSHFVLTDNDVEKVKLYLLSLQDKICGQLELLESSKVFLQDVWDYHSGGGGQSRVLEKGDVVEKGGVNFSHIKGVSLPESATVKRQWLKDKPFRAMGISLVIHPLNPYVPTTHANFRFFVADKEDGRKIWWFGGGYDLTPYYPFLDDCRHWHLVAKKACEPFGSVVYPKFKKQCDEYFYLKHRKETRGIGGILFDDLNEWSFETCFEFVQSVGNSFIDAYLPIIQRRKNLPWGKRERSFQCYRRGRYVEYNLLYDRGTIFGLQSGGRTESILMSLPPSVIWRYNWKPEDNSAESKLIEYLRPRDWLEGVESFGE